MRIFTGIQPQAFAGQISSLPVQGRNTGFGQQSTALPPSMVTIPITWASYGASSANPNIAIKVDGMQNTTARQALDAILSVRIDNLGNNVPVYVFFSDTGYTVACPPNTIIWEPVQTAQFSATIIGEGFTNLSGNTAVYFCNFATDPWSNQEIIQVQDLWLASNTITRGNSIYQQNFGIPALGDQMTSGHSLAPNDGATVTIFNFGGGFIYLTQLVIYVTGFQLGNEGVGNFAEARAIFESTGIAGIFAEAPMTMIGRGGAQNYCVYTDLQELIRLTGNYKLDGSQVWQMRWSIDAGTTTFVSGFVQIYAGFTTNPN